MLSIWANRNFPLGGISVRSICTRKTSRIPGRQSFKSEVSGGTPPWTFGTSDYLRLSQSIVHTVLSNFSPGTCVYQARVQQKFLLEASVLLFRLNCQWNLVEPRVNTVIPGSPTSEVNGTQHMEPNPTSCVGLQVASLFLLYLTKFSIGTVDEA